MAYDGTLVFDTEIDESGVAEGLARLAAEAGAGGGALAAFGAGVQGLLDQLAGAGAGLLGLCEQFAALGAGLAAGQLAMAGFAMGLCAIGLGFNNTLLSMQAFGAGLLEVFLLLGEGMLLQLGLLVPGAEAVFADLTALFATGSLVLFDIVQMSLLQMEARVAASAGPFNTAAQQCSTALVEGFYPMVAGGARVVDQMCAAMSARMDAMAGTLFAKADSIAAGIIARFNAAFDIHSPSRVMADIFTQVMRGAEVGLAGMESSLYAKVNGIGARVVAGFAGLAPKVPVQFAAAAKAAGGTAVQMPVGGGGAAGLGGGVVNHYTTNLQQTNVSPKALSAADMAREAQDFLRRSRWACS